MSEGKQKARARVKKFMNRNVTEFQHFMQHSYITENDLNWVINLRDNNIPPPLAPSDPHPPEVFFKKTKAFEIRCRSEEKETRKQFRPNQFDHMILKQEGAVKQTEDQLHFYSSLRSGKTATQSGNGKKFDSQPYLDRKQLPTFIKKESIRKLRQLTAKDKESALDAAHTQHPYTHKILATTNYGLLQTFTNVHGRSQVSLPSLAWEMGLRSYRS